MIDALRELIGADSNALASMRAAALRAATPHAAFEVGEAIARVALCRSGYRSSSGSKRGTQVPWGSAESGGVPPVHAAT
jgi:hypothetical protein